MRAATLSTAVLLVGWRPAPYTVRPGLQLVHRLIGSALFAERLLHSIWVARTRRTPLDAALVGVQLVAGILCFLSSSSL